jgi:hypothetical protein
MDLSTLRIVMATFTEVFPQNEVWLLRFNLDVPVIGLIGRTSPPNYSDEAFERRSGSNPQVAEVLKRLGLADSVRLFGNYLGPIQVPDGPRINTDWNPILIFNAPEHTFRRRDDPGERMLTLIQDIQTNPSSTFAKTTPEFSQRVDAYARARNIYLKGLSFDSDGDSPQAIAAYIESARVSADFTAGYAQAITIAAALARERPEQSRQILNRLAEARPERPVAEELLRRLSE